MAPEAAPSKRGVKRKRVEQTSEDPTSRIPGKLHHSLKEVKKAAKKAKTFETQKLVKKLKAVRGKDQGSSEVANLEAQLQALKAVDHDRVGCLALRNKLRKDKLLSKEPAMISAMSTELPSNLEPASTEVLAKVEARLFSSKALSSEVNSVISNLRAIFKPNGSSDGDGEVALTQSDIHTPSIPGPAQLDGSDDGSASAEEFEEPISDAVEDAGWESGTVDGDSAHIALGHAQSQGDSEDEDASDESDTGSLADVSDSSPRKRSKPAKPDDKKAKPKGLESTFLPSLSVGFTRGDSDSDWSDSEAKHADGARKNRRGQRARRAIWEKKYGKGAKHLAKRAEEEASRPGRQRSRDNANRPGPRHPSATSGENRSHSTRQTPPARHAPAASSGGARSALAPPRPSFNRAKANDEKPLHPSWEAKKRLKEKESAAIVPPQGKRIKFDD